MGDANDPFMRNRDAAVQARTKAQNRANVLQLKLIGQSHPTGLTNNLLKLFEARPPLEYKPPIEKRKPLPYSGMADYVSKFAEPGDPEYAPPVVKGETPAERRARIQKLRLEKGAAKAAEDLQKYDPSNDPNVTGDPYKTLFVARLNYETTEHQIKREFEAYGPIKRVRLITDKETNKPRGYAFIEYMHTRDMKTAYKQADGRKLDNRRVLVDVERGRTVPNWRPRRLGGGLGSTRIGGEDLNQKHSGREQQQVASGGPRKSEEPRAREDRYADRDREKSRDRGRDREREREKSRERSHDRGRDRDIREDRHHHRDRDRTRDRDRERDRGRDRDRDRDRIRGKDRERDRGRDYDRERERDRDRPRDRERERERGKDYERASHERDHGYKHEMDVDYDLNEPIPEQERDGGRDRELEPGEHDYRRDFYADPAKNKNVHGHGHGHEHEYDYNEKYGDVKPHGFGELEHVRERSKHHKPEYYADDRYEKMGGGEYQGKADEGELDQPEEGEARDHDYGYQRLERSLPRDDH
ncbi:U1 small nuclear ribonucleoprotein 70 kDa [Iris pallida]|uniref:U1 small nuclear ribonucleoprotein 70 kDa n=1 Tax=Iris pallida TaxID=29817 RepID=A0AAX6HS80_IRIPA|nr:U1 small nuclear ribonucleoprotein 70 kDa [Iris pallida]